MAGNSRTWFSFSRRLWLARLFLVAASATAAFLLSHTLENDGVPGCRAGSGCELVLSSSWAYVWRIPVSAPAFVCYSYLLVASFSLKDSRTNTNGAPVWALPSILSVAVVVAALWFVGLQGIWFRAFCKFCLVAHSTAVAGVLLLDSCCSGFLFGPTGVKLPHRRTALVTGSLLIVVMAAVQWLHPHEGALLRLYYGESRFRGQDVPILGSTNVSQQVVSLFDYTCPHCRLLHAELMEAQTKLGGRFAIVCLPAPLSSDCNPLVASTAEANQHACDYAKLGLAVWECDPGAYAKFDRWMFAQSAVPALPEAQRVARELVGAAQLGSALSSEQVERTLRLGVSLYQANSRQIGFRRLPQLIIGKVITVGSFASLDHLMGVLQTNLALESLPPKGR